MLSFWEMEVGPLLTVMFHCYKFSSAQGTGRQPGDKPFNQINNFTSSMSNKLAFFFSEKLGKNTRIQIPLLGGELQKVFIIQEG